MECADRGPIEAVRAERCGGSAWHLETARWCGCRSIPRWLRPDRRRTACLIRGPYLPARGLVGTSGSSVCLSSSRRGGGTH
ncbi:hypothetical protein GFS60_01549 [Rhodococcus sp. WAY2]|nr:hypothetical protein GFS60_01549 [Rhodococcus sp. WAY2]